MKLDKPILILLVAVALAACTKTSEQALPEPGRIVSLHAGMESIGTRTWLDSESGAAVLPVYWSHGDRINVNGQNSAPVSIEPGAKVSEAEFLLRSVTPPYNVVYPAEIVTGGAYSGGTIEITVPDTQDYAEGTFAPGTAILYGYSGEDDGTVSLRNLCAAVRVKLWGEESVIIEGAAVNSAKVPIAGRFTIKPEDGSLSAEEGVSNLSLNLGEGVSLSPEGTWFYFTLPAGEYPDSLMFTFTQKSDRRSMKCKWTPAQALGAGVLYSFSNVEFVPGAKDIETPDDWNEFAACVNSGGDMRKWLRNGTAHLAADISAVTLDQIKGAFVWQFDGQGHTITRTSGGQSLFRNIHGTVKNLNLAGSLASSGAVSSVLADTLYAGGAIIGCNNDASLAVEAEASAKAGAFAAVMMGGSIIGCTNRGPISVSVDCSSGTLDDLVLGGIAGQIDASLEDSSDALLKDCINSGTLLADPTYTLPSQTYGIRHSGIGGIAGWLCGNAHSFTIDNCDNTGGLTYNGARIVSKDGLAKFQISAGGIVGIAGDLNFQYGVFPTSGIGDNGLDVTFTNCDNSGEVHNCGVTYSGSTELNNKVYTGGIVGSLIGTPDKWASLASCSNTGTLLPYDITGDAASVRALYSQVAGGLIGYGGYVDIKECTVNCTIGNGKRQMYSLAGVIGLAIRTFSLTNSTVWFTGYFNRYNSNNHTNSASVAVPPLKFGSHEVSPLPSLGQLVIRNCRLGATLYYYNAPNTGTDDYSASCTSSTMLSAGASHIVRGWKWEYTEPYTIEDNTSLTSEP